MNAIPDDDARREPGVAEATVSNSSKSLSSSSSSSRTTLQNKQEEKTLAGNAIKEQKSKRRLLRRLLSSSWRTRSKTSTDTPKGKGEHPDLSNLSVSRILISNKEEHGVLTSSQNRNSQPETNFFEISKTDREKTAPTAPHDEEDVSQGQWTKEPEVSFRFDVDENQNLKGDRDVRFVDNLNDQSDEESDKSADDGKSFLQFFLSTNGPPQIILLCVILALSLGSTIGVVPPLVTDRYARVVYGLDDDVASCSTFGLADRPRECTDGNDAAQNAAAVRSLISNSLTFATSSVIGSISDEHGRRAFMLLGIFLSTLGPLCLLLLQLIPTMSPTWYYGLESISGVVNWVAISYSSLADVIPKQWRAPTFGLVLASFAAGFGFAPSLTLGLGHFGVTVFSLSAICASFVFALFFLPETLSPHHARAARRARAEREEDSASVFERTTTTSSSLLLDPGTSRPPFLRRVSSLGNVMVTNNIAKALVRPVRELSILNRKRLIRLLAILAFFSGMSGAADQVLLLYYVEERLEFNDKDVAAMFLIIGVLGIFVQAAVLKPLNDCIGERMVVVVAFTAGTIDNVLYGLATAKRTIFVAIALSTLTLMSFPTISAIKSNNVGGYEQGRIQGALYSVQSLSSALGPTTFRFIYHVTRDLPYPGPGTMFLCTALLFLVATFIAFALPPDQTDSRYHKNTARQQDDGNSETLKGSRTSYGSTGESCSKV